jgi:hypothetical protein
VRSIGCLLHIFDMLYRIVLMMLTAVICGSTGPGEIRLTSVHANLVHEEHADELEIPCENAHYDAAPMTCSFTVPKHAHAGQWTVKEIGLHDTCVAGKGFFFFFVFVFFVAPFFFLFFQCCRLNNSV